MNRAIPGRTFFASAYILLAIGFLTIHFTRVESFSTVVGGIVVKGRSSVGTSVSPPQIRRLKVNVNGIELLFRKGDRAALVTEDGIRHPVNVVDWKADDTSVSIIMENGTGFSIVSDPLGAGTTLIPEIPTTVPPVRSLELPFGPEGGSDIVVSPDHTGTLVIAMKDAEYMASLPSDSSWSADLQRLDLVVLGKAHPVLTIADRQRGGGLGVQEWFDQASVPSDAAYRDSIDAWLARSRDGWSSRVDARGGLWFDAKGQTGWDDLLAASVLADSVAQGQFQSTLQSVMSIGENAPQDIGWLPSPFLGNIVNQTRVRADEMRTEARAVSASLQTDAPVFGVPSALGTLVDSGQSEDANRLLNLARSAPSPDAGNADVIDRIRVLQEARKLALNDAAIDPDVRKGYFDAYLIPRISWVKDGLWLVEEDGSVNLPLGIAAGTLLMQEAQWSNSGLHQAIGRQLVISALGLADDQGMVPERILFEGDGSVVEEGSVPPENLYAAVTAAPAFPRHVSLAKELGTGSWALTGAERFVLRSTPRETTVTMDFPAGAIHHLAIRGIRKFNVLYMNGIRWNGDPNFQRYYAGWYYDGDTETLYVKIRHRAKTETIRILYYDPDAQAAPEAAAEEPAAPAG